MIRSLAALFLLIPSVALASGPATARLQPTPRTLLGRSGNMGFLQYRVDGFENLTARERVFAYHLTEAAKAGDEIAFDQMHRDSLPIRDLFQEMLPRLSHRDPETAPVRARLVDYYRKFWGNRGPYDQQSEDKLETDFSFEELRRAAHAAKARGAFRRLSPEALDARLAAVRATMFDAGHEPKLAAVAADGDVVAESAVNFYGPGVTQRDVEAHDGELPYPVVNRLTKTEDGRIEAEVYRAGDPARGIPPGRYAEPLGRVIAQLELAIPHASSRAQQKALGHLIRFFKSGDPKDFREYNRVWTHDDSSVDFILGFIETYADPLGRRPTFEGIITYREPVFTKVIAKLASLSSHLERQAPWDPRYKKGDGVPLTANGVSAIATTGDAGSKLVGGVNLPNDQALRAVNGAKNITLVNATDAVAAVRGSGALVEFSWTEEEVAQARRQPLAGRVHTALHEVGHSTGKLGDELLAAGKDSAAMLKELASTVEEGRADAFGLWAIGDPEVMKLTHEDGSPIVTQETVEASYRAFVRNVLVQTMRVKGKTRFTDPYDRERNLIVQYLIEKGAVTERVREGKFYLHVESAAAMREGVGELLGEIMRITAEGDYAAAKALWEKYADPVRLDWRDQVVERFEALNVPSRLIPINARLNPVYRDGVIVDARATYPRSLNAAILPRRRR